MALHEPGQQVRPQPHGSYVDTLRHLLSHFQQESKGVQRIKASTPDVEVASSEPSISIAMPSIAMRSRRACPSSFAESTAIARLCRLVLG